MCYTYAMLSLERRHTKTDVKDTSILQTYNTVKNHPVRFFGPLPGATGSTANSFHACLLWLV
jgi:hypothetical protein